MDIASFRTFVAAAEAGSFAGAAQRVHASPSSVTERIKQLENRLGATLFVRDKRGCRLTPAGEKFLRPARRAVRAWEFARHEIAMPERFTRSLMFGGQYLLWESLLLDWLGKARIGLPDLSIQVTSGASARLNRDLAEGALDMIVLHDPIFRNDIGTEPLFDDELILVTAGDPATWQETFVRIDWGRNMGLEIASRLDVDPQAGLALDLGTLSAQWLVRQRMAGYMPASAVRTLVAAGHLRPVPDAPRFDYPVVACWRRDCDPGLRDDVLLTLREEVKARGY